jgi:C4-dicarboxylate-specific signal transduction histidine kinase
MLTEAGTVQDARESERSDLDHLHDTNARLREQVAVLESHVRKSQERRRVMLHIMGDLNESNKRLSNQRKATLHILVDYEKDRSRLAGQTERLDNSRRALLHILQDVQQSNQRLENSRKAMIHIMDDLRGTTEEIQRREQELRDKQEQLVQAGKLATLGELTTGIAHELNNPLNNITLFLGNVIDGIELGIGDRDKETVLGDLQKAKQQVDKATQIITHLRTFGRAAPVSREPVAVNEVIKRALSLTQEQLRLRQIKVELNLSPAEPVVLGNSIQLEQVFINLLTNARDALSNAAQKVLYITSLVQSDSVDLSFRDTGPGIPKGLEQRIFDPFFTTKAPGAGTGLGLSIAYGIMKEHQGSISVVNRPNEGATFLIQLPLCAGETSEKSAP